MPDLLDLTSAQLRDLLISWSEAGYRAGQIDRWVYRELATDFEAMTDLPRDLREKLAQSLSIGVPGIAAETVSADGLTRKLLLSLSDGQTIETVLMLYADAPGSPELAEPAGEQTDFQRRTVCISTQVGCPIGCPFCATGQAGYIRNLSPGEIVAQVLCMERIAGPPTNIVFMGMGEPLMKFDLTWQAVESLTDPTRLGMGARRITISTSGEIPGIQRMAQAHTQVNLAISLHAPDDKLRNVLVPLNRRYPLADLMRAVRAYVQQTHRRVTFEYALMDRVNDSPEQARALAQMLQGLLCHVNLIPLNPTAASPYGRTPHVRVQEFEHVLRQAHIATTLRVEKGIEIAAGCGQLKQANSKRQFVKVTHPSTSSGAAGRHRSTAM